MDRMFNEDSLFNDKDFLYNLKVAEKCDFYRDSYSSHTCAYFDLKDVARKGKILDFILSYLSEHPKSKCKEIRDAYNEAYELNYIASETIQAFSTYLSKLINGGYVVRTEGEAEAIKIRNCYGDERAILVKPAFFSLAE